MLKRYTSYAVAIIALIGYFAVATWTQIRINPRFPSDIEIYLKAGEKAVEGMDTYQPFVIGSSFVYPPSALLIFGPLSSINEAKILWMAITITCLLGTLSILWFAIKPSLKEHKIIWLAVVALLFTPFLETLTIGQVNGVILLGLALFLLGVVEQKHRWTGDLGLVVAILIKITPLILVAWPLVRRDWNRLGRIVTGLLFLSLFSFLLYGSTPWKSFFEILPSLLEGHSGLVNQAVTPTLQWFVTKVSPGLDVSWFGRIFTVITLIVWLALLFLWGNKKGPLSLLTFGIVTMTVSSSLIWLHHLVFLIIPVFYLLFGKSRKTVTDGLLFVIVLVAYSLIHVDRLVESVLSVAPIASIIGYMLIYLVALATIIREPGEEA